MIITYIEGGLGNMLSQFAFTLAKAKDESVDYGFLNYKRNLEIIREKHNADVDSYENTILRNISFSGTPDAVGAMPRIEHFCPFEYRDIPYEQDCYNFYKGYFHSELYHRNQDDYLNSILKPTDEIDRLLKWKYPFLFKFNCLSMHVRRGDYLSLPNHHPVMDPDYYHRAVKLFSNIDKILVITNDIDWCYKNLTDSRIIYIEEPDWLSLYIMSYCKNHIIANSSFSWWGARLAEIFNKNQNINVVYPKKWFGPAINHDLKDMIPGRWRREP